MPSEVAPGIRIVGRVPATDTRIRRAPWGFLFLFLACACGERSGPQGASEPAIVLREEVPQGRSSTLPDPAVRHPRGSRIVRADVEPPLVLTEGMAAAGSPVASLDGQEILFTGKEIETEPYGIWACRLDGSERRRLVVEDLDCGVAAWLPDGGLVYARALSAPGPVEGMRSAWALFRKGPDVDRGKQITFGAGCDLDPGVLDDGRIVYASWQPLGGGGMFLWTAHPDGTGAARLPGDHGGDPFAVLPRQVIDKSPEAPARNVLLYELGPELVFADWRSTADVELDWDEHDPLASPFVRVHRIAPRHTRPQGHLSMLRKGYTNGTLLCLDARPAEHPSAARVRIKALRGPHGPGETPESQVLGEVPLAEDGSFFVSVPANTPLLLDLLDARGQLLDEGVTPFWVRPNETRACIGCHEPPDTAPPNRRPFAIEHDPFPLYGPAWGGGR